MFGLRRAEWAEFDLYNSAWSVPAAKMKMRRPHRVPLSRQSLAVIQELKAITGNGRWLFPSVRTPARSISENNLNAALWRLGYGPDDMSIHGFRAMAATVRQLSPAATAATTRSRGSRNRREPSAVASGGITPALQTRA